MGSEQGVIWNDSPFVVEYLVYGAFEEMGDSKIKRTINPKLQVELQKVNLSGFEYQEQSSVNVKYEECMVEVQPDRVSTMALTEIKMNQHKISVRIRVGKFVKYIVRNVVIKNPSDMCIKIRTDLSFKNMAPEEAKEKINSLKTRTQGRRQIEERDAYMKKMEDQVKFGLQTAYQKSIQNENN